MLPAGLDLGGLKGEKATQMKKKAESVAGWTGFRQYEVRKSNTNEENRKRKVRRIRKWEQ